MGDTGEEGRRERRGGEENAKPMRLLSMRSGFGNMRNELHMALPKKV